MSRVLFLIPHPDDEIVAAAATIARSRLAGTEVFGLFLTCGVPPADKMWRWERGRRDDKVRRRRDEAIAAAKIMGMEPVGFADWPSRSLKGHLPEALAWIGRIIAERKIDTLWVAAWEGGHQDHDVANFLAANAAGGRPVLEFAEYNLTDGKPNWQRFAVPNGTETVLILSEAEADAKRALLATYASEKGNLAAVKVQYESHRPLPSYDYTRPPYDGKLSREWLHWVGRIFPHPRVDFEPSENIYAALRAFRGGQTT
jgi:N-acetylglucosamine malate deacetylase 1